MHIAVNSLLSGRIALVGLIAVRWSACLKIRAGRATGLQSLALQFLSFRRGRQCPRFTIVSPHSGDCGARPVTRSVSALLTRSSRRRLNGFSGVSQYRVEDGPPPLLQRSRPKVPVDYSLVDGLSLVAGFHTSWSLCARAGLVTSRQTFVRRCHGGVCPYWGAGAAGCVSMKANHFNDSNDATVNPHASSCDELTIADT